MKIAVVGSGISGLGCAWLLNRRHDVTLYEAEPRLGGHANTVEVPGKDGPIPVDTGFIVYNERNYPNLTRLFATLDVPTHQSDMSFGASVDGGRMEYSGSSLGTLFAQRRNVVRLAHHRMLLDIVRFNRQATRFVEAGEVGDGTLEEFLRDGRYGEAFERYYLLPMAAAIWSASIDDIRRFPARYFLAFFRNHGLLTVTDQPQWRTVTGGSRVYVERLSRSFAHKVRRDTPVAAVRRTGASVEVIDWRGGRERFDHVVLACHADQALALIAQPSAAEREILGAFPYQSNRAVLHRDPALMPKRRAVWSSWNYMAATGRSDAVQVSVTYWLNRLQGIDPECLALVSLNPVREPAPESVLAEFSYRHPRYTAESFAAHARLGQIQGRDRLWFAGAYWGWGFHEDGLLSGLRVGDALGVTPPWWPTVSRIRAGAARTMPERSAAEPA